MTERNQESKEIKDLAHETGAHAGNHAVAVATKFASPPCQLSVWWKKEKKTI